MMMMMMIMNIADNDDDDDEYDYNDYNDHTSDHESDLPRASSPRSCWRAKPGRRGTG